MSTQFTNRQWRLPNNENKDKQSNYSMDFDGSSYIDLGTYTQGTGLALNADMSISAWVKTSNLSTTQVVICNLNSGGSIGGYCIEMNRQANGQYGILYNGQTVGLQGSTILSSNTWYHIVMTRTGTSGNWSYNLYLNGNADGSANNVAQNFDNGSVAIGRFGAYNGGYFNGQIDAVSIFNYALSSSQITTLYGSSSTGIGNPMSLSPKPVFYAPLGDQDAFNGANYLVPNSSLKDYVFDFDNDYIDTNYSITSGNKTISFWFNSSYAGYQSIMGNTSDSFILGYWSSQFAVPQGISYLQGSTSKAFAITASVTDEFADGNWHHFVYTYDGNSKIYIDGTERTISYKSGTTSSDDIVVISNLSLGLNRSGYPKYNGKLSNVQIFNTALPATGSNSIETLYNNGSPLTSMSGFTSLQGWWKLNASDTYDSSTGNWTIEDHAGSNDGTSSGMTQANLVQSDLSFTSGYSPYALEFDAASNNKITASSNSNFNTGDLSASIWINASNLGNNIKYFFGNSNALATAGFTFSVNTSTGNAWYIGRATTTHMYVINNVSINFTNNVWNHLCFSYDDTTKDFILYLNGASVNSGTATSTTKNASGSIIFGGHNVNYDLTGKLSNASIWNTALTSAQVTEIYNEGVPSNLNNHSAYSNLVSWWQLGSNSSFNTNWTVLDEVTASGNNGTSVNMGEDAIVDGVGSYANGLSSGMGGDEVIGDAPYSSSNALSVNMDVEDRVTDTPS